MPKRTRPLPLMLAFGLAALIVFSGGCKKKAAETTPEPTQEAQQAETEPAPPARQEPDVEVEQDFPQQQEPFEEPQLSVTQINELGILKTVFFGYDKHDLTDETRRLLRENAVWIKNHPEYSVVIQGHCDERGTIEYNLALGQRRANALREYLVGLGADSGRMRIVSYGEERTVDPGHDESAWSQNRRGAFVVEQ